VPNLEHSDALKFRVKHTGSTFLHSVVTEVQEKMIIYHLNKHYCDYIQSMVGEKIKV